MNRTRVSLVRDRGPAASAQDEMSWPPFLIRNNLGYTPTAAKWLPRESFCWCPRPLSPHPPSIHLYPSNSNSTCSLSSGAALLEEQRSFCFGGQVRRLCPQSRFHSPFQSATRFFLGGDERLFPRETAKWKQRDEIFQMIHTFLTALTGLTLVWKYVHLLPWKHRSHLSPAFPLSILFSLACCNLWLVSGG